MLDTLTMKLVPVYFSLHLYALRFVVEITKAEDEAFRHYACSNHALSLELDCQPSHGSDLHREVEPILAFSGLDTKLVGSVEKKVLKQTRVKLRIRCYSFGYFFLAEHMVILSLPYTVSFSI